MATFLRTKRPSEGHAAKDKVQSGFDGAHAPYFTEEVRRQLIRQFASHHYDGGLSVRTTLDPFLQQVADNALERGLEALDRRQGWRGPLGVLENGADVDEVLAKHTAKLRPNYATGDQGWAA